MYINAVAKSVMLQLHLRCDFHNIIFQIEHKLYTTARSDHTLSVKNYAWAPVMWCFIHRHNRLQLFCWLWFRAM